MNLLNKGACLLLSVIILITAFPGVAALAESDNEQPQIELPQEPVAAANVEQIVWTEEIIDTPVVLDDGNIHVIDSMTSIAEGGSLEVKSGALLIANSSKLLGDVRVTGNGVLMNNGVIDGTLYGDTETNALFAVAQALGLDGSVNIINADGAHINTLVINGMTRTINMGTLDTVEIQEGLLSPFDNTASGIIDRFTSMTESDVVNNVGTVREVIAKGKFWNGNYGHVDTVYIEKNGMYMNHDGASTDTVYVNGGELNNHQGYPTNLNEWYPEYAIATIDTVVLNAPLEEAGVWNGGYIRTLTGYSGSVKNYGCIDYLLLSQGTEYSFLSSAKQYEAYMKYREERQDDSVAYEDVFPSLMDRNGIYWELSNCRSKFIGDCIVDTLRADSVWIEGDGMYIDNLCLFGRASASVTLGKPLDRLLFCANGGYAAVKGEAAAIHQAGIFSNNSLQNECAVETLYIADENTDRASRYVHGVAPDAVIGAAQPRQKTVKPENGSKSSAEKVNVISSECYKAVSDELWYVTKCEKFAALSLHFSASSMGMATVYTPQGEAVYATSAGEEASVGCIAEEAGAYYIRVSGGEGNYALTLDKKEPIRISYSIHRELADGSLLSIPECKEEYRVTLLNSTTGKPITGSVYTGEEILVVPDQANAGDTLQAQIQHLNGKTVDAAAECYVQENSTATFDATVLPKGRYKALCENTQDACAYLFREDGTYEETLERLTNGFISSPLDAGSYTAVLIQGGQGLYKFPTLADYAKGGLTAETDYLLKEILIQDGRDTEDGIETIPEAPKATHPALNAEACAYTVGAAEAVSGAMVAAKLEYLFQDTAGVIGNIQARIQLGAGAAFVDKSAAVNGKSVDAVMEGDTLVIPLSKTSGTACFYITPNTDEAAMVSAARLAFTLDGASNTALIGSASVKITNLSLHAPQYASSDKVLLWGNGSAEEEITILDNGIEAGKAQCDKAGFWSQTITLQQEANAGIHSLYATCNNVCSVASTLRITAAAPSLVNFTLYYMYHDSVQKLEIPGEMLGTAPVSFDYVPGSDLTFSLHMTQNERIDRLFVNAEMDGEVRTLEAYYDASAGRWDAVGRFGDEMSFVPGTFSISYTPKSTEQAEVVETEYPAGDDDEEPIFTDASVAVLSTTEYEDHIGWEAQLMITLTGKTTVDIPAAYTDELIYAQDAEAYLLEKGFTYAGRDEKELDTFIRCTETEGEAEVEVAKLLPMITTVGTAKQYLSLLVAALESGQYDIALEDYGVSEADYTEMLNNELDATLADLEYAQNVVKDLENCRLGGDLEQFCEEYSGLLTGEPTGSTVLSALSERSLPPYAQTGFLSSRKHSAGFMSSKTPLLGKAIDCAINIKRFKTNVDAIIEGAQKIAKIVTDAVNVTGKQAQTYAEWRGAQKAMEQSAETMYQISVSDHPEYYQEVYKDAEQQYERAKQRNAEKKAELQKRCAEVILFSAVGGAVGKTVGKITEATGNLFGKAAVEALAKGLKTPLGQKTLSWGKNLIDIAKKLTKDQKLGKHLEALAKELDARKTMEDYIEDLTESLSDKLEETLTQEIFKKLGYPIEDEEDDDPIPFIGEMPIPDLMPQDDKPIVIAVTPAKPKIDPSGYVYEAVRSNRIEGVMTTVYYKGADGTPVFWDAEEYGQENPLYTNSIGYYEWFVPSGEWQVVYEMPGYETYVTDWLPVPPPQTEVNVGIVSYEPPTAQVYFHRNSVELLFSRYMRVEDVRNAAFTLNDANGAQRSLTLQADHAEAAADGSGTMLASRFTATIIGGALQIGKTYSITLPAGMSSYAGVGTQQQKIEGICCKGVKEIKAEETLLLEAGGVVRIPIRVTAEGIPTGIVLDCTSSQRGIAQVLSVSPVSITGFCVVTVKTSRVGVVPLQISTDNSGIAKTISVQVAAEGSVGKETGVSFLKARNQPVDWLLIAGVAILVVLLAGGLLIVVTVRRRKTAVRA